MVVTERRVAAATVLLGAVVLVAVAIWRVPWQPAPGGTPPAVSASAYFTAEQLARADHYSRWARGWSWGGIALGLLVSVWLALAPRARHWASRVRGPWWVRVPVLVALVVLATAVVRLPTTYGLWSLQRRHGISTQSWIGVAEDLGVSSVVSVLVTMVALLGLVGCARRLPRLWPLVVGLAAAVLVVFGSFVYPVLIEPLTVHTTPLPGGALRSRLLSLASAEGVQVDDVLVADASSRTTALNAYVSGFAGTRRIVLYDTTVRDLPRDQIEVVVAHELGHAATDDVLTGTLLAAAAAPLGVGLLALTTRWLAVRRRRPPVRSPDSVPLLLALVTLALFVSDPVVNLVSRDLETRADVASLTTTRDPAAFVAVQRRLALSALQDPTPPPLSQWWFGTHPTPVQRIALAGR